MISPLLAIDADDYGYAASYDAGIVEAARAGAIDGASVMAMREPDPAPLIEAGIELGLHLEPEPGLGDQLGAFLRLTGRDPAYVDGHHHCHAAPELAAAVARLAAELGVPVRAVDTQHQALLAQAGVPAAELLVGRLDEAGPALPPTIVAWREGLAPQVAVVEWMVHPGRPDPSTASAYDAGRGEDLRLLLELGDRERWARLGVRRESLGRALSRS